MGRNNRAYTTWSYEDPCEEVIKNNGEMTCDTYMGMSILCTGLFKKKSPPPHPWI